MGDRRSLTERVRREPGDGLARLALADWLDEHGEPAPAARLRWWAWTRMSAVAAAVPAGAGAWRALDRAVRAVRDPVVRRLYAVEAGRAAVALAPGYRPPDAGWPPGCGPGRVARAVDDCWWAAERFALGLADRWDLAAAHGRAGDVLDALGAAGPAADWYPVTAPLESARAAAGWSAGDGFSAHWAVTCAAYAGLFRLTAGGATEYAAGRRAHAAVRNLGAALAGLGCP